MAVRGKAAAHGRPVRVWRPTMRCWVWSTHSAMKCWGGEAWKLRWFTGSIVVLMESLKGRCERFGYLGDAPYKRSVAVFIACCKLS